MHDTQVIFGVGGIKIKAKHSRVGIYVKSILEVDTKYIRHFYRICFYLILSFIIYFISFFFCLHPFFLSPSNIPSIIPFLFFFNYSFLHYLYLFYLLFLIFIQFSFILSTIFFKLLFIFFNKSFISFTFPLFHFNSYKLFSIFFLF